MNNKTKERIRLIHKQNIIDSIFKYELNNNTINQQHIDCYQLFHEAFDDCKKAVDLAVAGSFKGFDVVTDVEK
jgi:hypothetical protein